MQIDLLESEAQIVVYALNNLIASYNKTAAKYPTDKEIQSVLRNMKARVELVLDKF